MSDATTHVGEFRREGDVWEAQARDIPAVHTFGRSLAAARGHLRDAIALWLDVPVESITVEVAVRFDNPELDDAVTAAMEARRAAEAAAKVTQDTARALYAHGMTYRDIATALGISHQRVGQLVPDQQAS